MIPDDSEESSEWFQRNSEGTPNDFKKLQMTPNERALFLRETLGLLDRKGQLFGQLLVVLVRRQVQAVEAGVTAW